MVKIFIISNWKVTMVMKLPKGNYFLKVSKLLQLEVGLVTALIAIHYYISLKYCFMGILFRR